MDTLSASWYSYSLFMIPYKLCKLEPKITAAQNVNQEFESRLSLQSARNPFGFCFSM